ncbi:sure-like protein [Eremomyces bilateralis CBS 781.70]|uniref:Sure-like protein n=1 Tax=Eremomyces bilateralis CBS 781.70 TaxID=1392243 RepID=A0A6G1GC69_9PEZI|nr:sure-like protein [Eremomyces bilateralis CBS 781.70]KAF1815624.1 sure-like protein [Eremomyces bilateralis CBS 781.70]
MHILVVNDDGPPSQHSSPYVHSLIRTLQSHNHTVSVVLPNTQRSWIGKAHMVGQTVKPSYFLPGELSTAHDTGTVSHAPQPPHSDREEWLLVDSTPASCVQIGLHHYFDSRGPIDLVVSGPNYGRNTTAAFALSSGTLGGALEAAICGVRAIALSYAFSERVHHAEVIAEAAELGVRLIEHLTGEGRWGEGVQLYSINVPVQKGIGERKVYWTKMLQNQWKGSQFREEMVPVEEDEGAEEGEERIREGELWRGEGKREQSKVEKNGEAAGPEKHVRYVHKHFTWSPNFQGVYETVEKGGPGSDGWVVKEGFTSVTPIKANFWHVDGFEGELKF